MKRFHRLNFDRLEDRCNPSRTWGGPIDHVSWDLARLYDTGDATGLQADGLDRVAVRVTSADLAATMPCLTELGFFAEVERPDAFLVEGWLPISALPAAESLGDSGILRGIVPTYRPYLDVGNVTSQGVDVLQSNFVNVAAPTPYKGAGIKVGVISDSFGKVAQPVLGPSSGFIVDVNSGDLPTALFHLSDAASGSDEGRAMMQLVYDVAPEALLGFATYGTGEGTLANAVDLLAAAGANIIVDDLTFITEPVYQDGLVSKAYNKAMAAGILGVSNAGNNTKAYERVGFATTTDPQAVGGIFLNFSSTGTDSRNSFTVPTGVQYQFVLQWDDPWFSPGNVKTNLDLIAVYAGTNTIVSSGTNPNTTDDMPFENIFVTGEAGKSIEFLVRHLSGPLPGRVHLSSRASAGGNFEYAAGTAVFGSNGAASVLSVGATDYSNQTIPAALTSVGPAISVFDPSGNRYPSPITMLKPDVVGPHGGNTTFFGGDDGDADLFPNFFGTSAAAPHVAGVAALVRQANPTFTPTQVMNAIRNSARDLATSGWDNTTGFGLVNARAATLGGIVPTNLPYGTDFNNGALGREWEAASTGAGRVRVTSDGADAGRSLLMDAFDQTFPFGYDSANQAVLHFNGTQSSGSLVLRAKNFDTSGSVYDAVSLSVDGTNFFPALSTSQMTNAWKSYTIDLFSIAAQNGVALSADTRIRFSQVDNRSWNTAGDTDGIGIDSIILSAAASYPAANRFWDGGAGTQDWFDADNWSGNVVPSFNDRVLIGSGFTVNVNGGAEAKSLYNEGTLNVTQQLDYSEASYSKGIVNLTGFIRGGHTLTLFNTMNWDNGGFSTLTGTSKTVILPGVSVNLSGAAPKVFTSTTIENYGIFNWGGSGDIASGHQFAVAVGQFNNHGQFAINTDADWIGDVNTNNIALPIVHDAGATFIKQGSSGTTDLNGYLDLRGNINIASGSINAGLGGNFAAITISTGTLNLYGGQFTADHNASITGTVTINGGDFFANVDISNTFSILNINTGKISGIGTVTITKSSDWLGGGQFDNGRTVYGPNCTLTIGNASHGHYSRFIDVYGQANWNFGDILSGDILGQGPGLWTMKTGSTIKAFSSADWLFDAFYYNSASPFTMESGTTFTRSNDADVTKYEGAFNSSGTIDLVTGTLQLTGGGVWGSTMISQGPVRLTSGTFSMNNNAHVNGFGVVRVDGAKLVVDAGNAAQFVNLDLNSGSIGGVGTLTITNTSSWTGGDQIDNGKTIYDIGTVLSITGNTHGLYSRLVDVSGNVTWSSGDILSGDILGQMAGHWTMKNGSAITLSSKADWLYDAFYYNGASPFTLQPGTTFTRTTDTEVTKFEGAFNSTSTIDLVTGTLQLSGGGVWGSTMISKGPVRLTGGTFSINNGASVNGFGVVRVDGAKLVVDAGNSAKFVNLDLNSGSIGGVGTLTITNTSSWTGGDQNDNGKTIYDIGTVLSITSNTHGLYSRFVEMRGFATWTGGDIKSGTILGQSPGAWVVKPASTMTLTSKADWLYDAFYYDFASPFTIESNATLTRTTDAEVTKFEGPFNHSGVINLAAGSLQLTAGGIWGASQITQGLVRLTGGTFTTDFGASVVGTGVVRVDGATLFVDDGKSASFTNLDHYSGAITGLGTLVISFNSTWLGGSQSDHGKTIYSGLGVFNIAGGDHGFYSREIETYGTVNWSAGHIRSGTVLSQLPAAWAVKAGTMTITTDADWLYDNFYYDNAAPIVVEAGGTLKKTAGLATTTFQHTITNNGGTVEALVGTIAPTGAYLQTGGTTRVVGVLDPTNLMTIQAGSLEGTGTILTSVSNTGGTIKPGLSPGALSIVGNLNPAGKFELELNGTAAGEFDRINVNGAVTLNGALTVSCGFAPAVGNLFTIIDNDGTDAVAGTFTGLAQGATFTAGGVQFQVLYDGGTGNDVTITVVNVVPVVTTITVNDGALQRSRLTKIAVNFASPVDASIFQTPGAVTLTRTGIPTNNQGAIGTVVNLSNGLVIAPASGTVSSITITFTNVVNSGVEFGSLADGRWQLAVNPAGYLSPNAPGDVQLRRFFGNFNNDTTVDGNDLGFFPNFGAAVGNPFDSNNNSDIDAGDFAELGNRFGFTLI